MTTAPGRDCGRVFFDFDVRIPAQMRAQSPVPIIIRTMCLTLGDFCGEMVQLFSVALRVLVDRPGGLGCCTLTCKERIRWIA